MWADTFEFVGREMEREGPAYRITVKKAKGGKTEVKLAGRKRDCRQCPEK